MYLAVSVAMGIIMAAVFIAFACVYISAWSEPGDPDVYYDPEEEAAKKKARRAEARAKWNDGEVIGGIVFAAVIAVAIIGWAWVSLGLNSVLGFFRGVIALVLTLVFYLVKEFWVIALLVGVLVWAKRGRRIPISKKAEG